MPGSGPGLLRRLARHQLSPLQHARGSALTLTAERPAGRGQAFAWRARGRLRRLWSNTDRGDSELARRVLEGRDAGLEEGHHRPVGPRVIDRPGYAGAFHGRRRLPPDRLTRQQLASSLRRDFPSREGARGCRQLAFRGRNASWWSGASSTASRTHSSGSKGGDGVGSQQCPPCPPLPCPESGQRDHAEGQANGDVQRTNQARQRG